MGNRDWKLIDFVFTGFQPLLQDNRKDILALMYRLLSRVHALDKLKTYFFDSLKVGCLSHSSWYRYDPMLINAQTHSCRKREVPLSPMNPETLPWFSPC